MKKNFKYMFFSIVAFMFYILNVNALTDNIICQIGNTDGLLYSSEWSFVLRFPPYSELTDETSKFLGIDNSKALYTFSYSNVQLCETGGCSENSSYNTSSMGNVIKLDKDEKFANLGTGKNGMYTTSQLIDLLNNGICPKYVYVASNRKEEKIGFIFSSKEVSNAKEIFENSGYNVAFEQNGGEDLEDINIINFENHIEKMKAKLEEYKNGDWGNTYNEKCSGLTYFGGMNIDTNVTLEYFFKYKKELPKTYNTDEASEIYSQYINTKCAEYKPSGTNNPGNGTNINADLSGCIIDSDTQEIIDWILNMVRFVGIILVIVLGMLDFIKATASGEQEEVKKSRGKFVKRLIACIALFLAPIIVDLLLWMINSGSTNC